MKIGTLCSTKELIYILSIFLCWEFIVRDQTRSSRWRCCICPKYNCNTPLQKRKNVTKKEWIDIFLWKFFSKYQTWTRMNFQPKSKNVVNCIYFLLCNVLFENRSWIISCEKVISFRFKFTQLHNLYPCFYLTYVRSKLIACCRVHSISFFLYHRNTML